MTNILQSDVTFTCLDIEHHLKRFVRTFAVAVTILESVLVLTSLQLASLAGTWNT